MSIAEEALQEEKARVERLECEHASEVKNARRFVAKHRETSETTSRHLADGKNSVTVSELNLSLSQRSGTSVVLSQLRPQIKLKTAKADAAFQQLLRVARLKGLDACTAELAELQQSS